MKRADHVRRPRFYLLLVTCFLCLCPAARANDWTSPRGPEQNGVSREVDLPDKFSLAPKSPDSNLFWSAPYPCRSTPIVMNGRVYLNNSMGEKVMESERVMCLDEKTGKKLWEKRFGIWHTDIVSVRLGWTYMVGDPKTGNLYWHGTQGLLVCFDRDGKILWQHSLTEEFGRISGYGGRLCSPVLDEDLVIIGMLNASWGSQGKGANRYLAMNKKDGKVVWWWESPHKPHDTYYSYPVVAVINNQRVLITGAGDGFVHCLKVRTGEHLWSFPITQGGVNPSPVVAGNLVYCFHGAENIDNNIQGGLFCLDASKVADGKPAVVWKKYGIPAQYASPILHEGRLYISTDLARLVCLDARSGKQIWRINYGNNAQGAPVWADGKIYVGAVDGTFSIIADGKTKAKKLHEQSFTGANGQDVVEITATPAVANGKVYIGTSEGVYCIGKKDHTGKAGAIPPLPAEKSLFKEGVEGKDGFSSVRLEPADVTVLPGDQVQFVVKALDANGRETPAVAMGTWSLLKPPPPPNVKATPPVLKGKISEKGLLVVDATVPNQQGVVLFKSAHGVAKARVRVAPRLPYTENFEQVADGLVPGGWVNTQGKFAVVTLKEGGKVLRNNNKIGSPLVARALAYFGLPTWANYTVEADVKGTKVGSDLPDMGVVAHRYRLVLFGNVGQLKIDAWDAIPRVSVSAPFKAEPDVWYRFKFKVQMEGQKAHLYGKAWPRDQGEPKQWQLEFTDANPIPRGSAALYSYSTGILGDRPGTEVFFDNVRVTPNTTGESQKE